MTNDDPYDEPVSIPSDTVDTDIYNTKPTPLLMGGNSGTT